MKKAVKMVGCSALVLAGIAGNAMADTAATVTALETSATGAITTVESTVVTLLTAGIVLTVSFWVYAKVKKALRAN